MQCPPGSHTILCDRVEKPLQPFKTRRYACPETPHQNLGQRSEADFPGSRQKSALFDQNCVAFHAAGTPQYCRGHSVQRLAGARRCAAASAIRPGVRPAAFRCSMARAGSAPGRSVDRCSSYPRTIPERGAVRLARRASRSKSRSGRTSCNVLNPATERTRADASLQDHRVHCLARGEAGTSQLDRCACVRHRVRRYYACDTTRP